MDRQIADSFNGRNENHILPFLWMRGEEEETIRKELAAIAGCGIGAVCLESRPHPDFAGPLWWRDFDVVLDEAKKRDMKIWILDDAHFPTGMANGLLPKKYPERAKQYLSVKHFDLTGPVTGGTLDVADAMVKAFSWMDIGKPVEKTCVEEEKPLSIVAARLHEDDLVTGEPVLLAEDDGNGGLRAVGDAERGFRAEMRGGTLVLDVPEGVWRIFLTHTTYAEGTRNDYINIIDEESVKVLIEAVYEPHYERYAEEFGRTIAGFFSDEPGFGNTFGFGMDEAIGRKEMPLPWNGEVPDMLRERLGQGWRTKLPLLFFDGTNREKSSAVRLAYMDVVTRLYQKNFSEQLGKWCAGHGVEYIGHVIEDNNEHSHLGNGAGHYFRAMSGQAMAGIDVIGHQIVPGRPNTKRHAFSTIDGPFFHYTLTKLGASAALLQTGKKGRLMCEAFGAYGWSFGVRDMKWVADHLISRGVNYLVPHAFSMAPYPDTDCPPHFYAGGHNPEYPYFARLMRYCNRLCHVFSEGVWQPEVGILYDAEQDWMGDTMRDQVPARILYENSIDYCFVPADALETESGDSAGGYRTEVRNGRLTLSGVPLKALIVPGAEYTDPRVRLFAEKHPDVKIVFVGRAPENYAAARVVQPADLASALEEMGVVGARTNLGSPLSFYHYRKESGDLWMVFNESASRRKSGEVLVRLLNDSDRVWRYDAMKNRIFAVDQIDAAGFDTPMRICSVALEPYESVVLFSAAEEEVRDLLTPDSPAAETAPETDLSAGWELTVAPASDNPVFRRAEELAGETPGGTRESLFPPSEPLRPVSDALPRFSGFMRYRREIEIRNPGAFYILEAEHIGEAARVLVNGEEADFRLCPPYRFEIDGLFRKGTNVLEVEAVNTPERDVLNYDQGPFGHEKGFYEPSGMFGRVVLKECRR